MGIVGGRCLLVMKGKYPRSAEYTDKGCMVFKVATDTEAFSKILLFEGVCLFKALNSLTASWQHPFLASIDAALTKFNGLMIGES